VEEPAGTESWVGVENTNGMKKPTREQGGKKWTGNAVRSVADKEKIRERVSANKRGEYRFL